MRLGRRTVLTGLASAMALPAWAQGIGRQSDPYAQVDPYADPRNGFSQPAPGRAGGPQSERGGASPQNPFVGGRQGFAPVSAAEEEIEVQRGMAYHAADLEKAGGPLPDRRVQSAMQSFCQDMFQASDRPGLPWIMTVNRIDQFQALAYSGGRMIMYPGTIKVSDHPGELAAIVAHEIGHCVYSHSWKRIQTVDLLVKQAKEDKALSGALDQLEGVGVHALDAMIKSYGREDEFQADDYILVLFERLGIHPGHALSMYSKMIKYYDDDHGADNSLYSTHPGTVQRMERMIENVRRLPKPDEQAAFRGWEVLKAAFPTPGGFRNG